MAVNMKIMVFWAVILLNLKMEAAGFWKHWCFLPNCTASHPRIS